MTRVDFYILDESSDTGRLRVAARIAEKAMHQNQHVYINTSGAAESSRLDEILWTFSQGSFVPHGVVDATPAEAGAEPVLIGSAVEINEPCEVLINLGPEVPEFFSRYDRVAEIVDAEATRRDAGRTRYKYYRDRGYELKSHNL